MVINCASNRGATEDGLDELVLTKGLGEVVLSLESVMRIKIVNHINLRPSGLQDISRGRQPWRVP